jgi:hypothetical protein
MLVFPAATKTRSRAQVFVRGFQHGQRYLPNLPDHLIPEVLAFEQVVPRHFEVSKENLSAAELSELQGVLNLTTIATEKIPLTGFSTVKYYVGADKYQEFPGSGPAGTLFFFGIEFRPSEGGLLKITEPTLTGFKKVLIYSDPFNLRFFTTDNNTQPDLAISGATTWIATAEPGRNFCLNILRLAQSKPPAALIGDPKNLRKLLELFQQKK